MTLAVRKLSTRCRAAKRFEQARSLVHEAARGPLIEELSASLGPSLEFLPAIVRLRTLRVRFAVPGRVLSARLVAEAWARAFSQALHRALAYPENDGMHAVRRYQSTASYRAALLHHVATGGPIPSWQFPELDEFQGAVRAEAGLHLLIDEPARIVEIVAALDGEGWLETVVALWDEHALERLMRAAAESEIVSSGLMLADLVHLARLAAAHDLWRAGSFSSRRHAVRLWARLATRFAVRDVWHGLRLIRRLLETAAWSTGTVERLLADSIPFPPWCQRAVAELIGARQGDGHPALVNWGSVAADFENALDELRPAVPSAVDRNVEGRWLASDCAGVLLLLGTARRMGFWALAREAELVAFGGPRAVSFLLTAVAMTLLGGWQPGDAVEPVVALFAGIDGEPDRNGLIQFFDHANLAGVEPLAVAPAWPEALQMIATELARQFAQQLRGFRHATREAVVKQFIRIPGRVLIEDQRLRVVLDSNPWAVALHVAGADAALERVEWCGDRRVEFVLEGV